MRKRGMALRLGIAASVAVLGLSGQVAQAATPDQGAGVRATGACKGTPTYIRPAANTDQRHIDTCQRGDSISLLCWLNGENTEGSRRWYVVLPLFGVRAGFVHASGVKVGSVSQCEPAAQPATSPESGVDVRAVGARTGNPTSIGRAPNTDQALCGPGIC